MDAPDFWQFSSRGRLAGSGSTNIDLNVFFGSEMNCANSHT